MDLSLHQYRLPFRRPFRMGQKTWTGRSGYLILADLDGITAAGEAAPLPGFSRESLSESYAQAATVGEPLRTLLTTASGMDDLADFHLRHDLCPSLRFAIDTLWTDLNAQVRGISPGELLFRDPPNRLNVNAVLPIDDPQTVLAEAEQAYGSGYRTFKFKTGREPGALFSLLEMIRSRWTDVALRIDANRSWNLAEARGYLQRLAPLQIEYCEEPLTNPLAADYRTLRADCLIPLALDETLADSDFDRNLLSAIDIFILKPMVSGSFTNILATKRLADDHDIGTVVTTALEGGIGRMMTAILAGEIGSPDVAHGLSTGSILQKDISADTIQDGQVDPASIAGLPKVEYGTLKEVISDSVVL